MPYRLLIISLLTLTVNVFSESYALAASVLKNASRNDDATRIQLLFFFDQLPVASLNLRERRVDVELLNTIPGETFDFPPTDDRIVKTTSKILKGKTVLSVYFRYAPQKATLVDDKGTSTLTLEIISAEQSATSYLSLPLKTKGTAPYKQTPASTNNPLTASIYAKKWPSFFTEYEPPLEFQPAPRLTLPPFPLAVALPPQTASENWLPEEIIEQAREGRWTQVYQMLREEVERQGNEKIKERLVLAYAEALVRAGEYKEPYYLLQRIMLQYPDSLMADLANFLMIYQQTVRTGDHINAYYELTSLFKRMEDQAPLTPSFKLLLAELALKSGRNADAEKLLTDRSLVESPALNDLRLIRLADLLHARDNKVKSLTAYLELPNQAALVNNDPMSLANLSDSLYTARRYPEAAKRYQLLGDLLAGDPAQGSALFRLALCQLRIPGLEKRARIDLQLLQDAFAGTKGGLRARIKQTDLDYASKRIKGAEAAAHYAYHATEADTLALQEEVLFKQALALALTGEQEASVTLCMELLRGFHAGSLKIETKALLLQQLPGVIRQLVKQEQFIKALVLAKQNKNYFRQGWLDINLLYDLAKAHDRLGMNAQTAQIYQYLFNVTSENEKEKIYLPLIQSLFSSGQYAQAEEYTDKYLQKYPKKAEASAIYLLKAQILYHSGQLDKALKLLTAENRPNLVQVDLLKARLYYETKQWRKVIDTLSLPALQGLLAKNGLLPPLAEAYFQEGDYDQAAVLFRGIVETDKNTEQAQFRLAQIENLKNKGGQALKLFEELAEKGKDTLWTRMAAEEASILRLKQR